MWASWRDRAASALTVAIAIAATAASFDATGQSTVNGKTLYQFYCQACHSPDPATMIAPFNLIMTAANDPAQIDVAAATFPSQMGFIPQTLSTSDKADIAAYLATFDALASELPVVEFYNAGQDHYFISASVAEIADLDNGVHPGWARTGQSFNAYTAEVSGTSPVCRFYIPPQWGDSHFYSASPDECAEVRTAYPMFDYESASVFFIAVPDTVTGACPAAAIPVYRLWDQRADTNHRYTTSLAIKQQMTNAGWVAEGYGPNQVIMCAPP